VSPDRNRPVLITGCSSGLGYATALAFANAGYRTIATARNPANVSTLRQKGCQILQLDVSDDASRLAAIAEAERMGSPIGILINNAGYGQYGPLEEITMQAMQRVFATNVFGLLALTQLVLPRMRAAGSGRIVNISSVAGRVSIQGGGSYHMTKHALEALSDALRPEVKPFGVDVVQVLPGPFISSYLKTLIANLPDTGPASPYRLFKENIESYMRDFLRPDRVGVKTADAVARVVLKAATATRPRPRYSVGFISRLGPLGRALVPDRIVDYVTSRQIPHDRRRD
jgi:NAD(P)-dependent dehydrogenase (short-subunit alcohol dehydrogenase family)